MGAGAASAQENGQVRHQQQVWLSLNNTGRLSEKWGVVADFHIRRNHYLKDPGFYFLRFGVAFFPSDRLTFAAGYGHMWLAGAIASDFMFVNENRIYQQAQHSSKWGKIQVVHRIRNEQRWSQQLAGTQKTDRWQFTNRIRYLFSITVPVSEQKKIPSLVLADELMVHFGKNLVRNHFDQNRLFAGIRMPLMKNLSFDAGYMLVYQRKRSGYQYDMNHTLRCFFYYTPRWDLRSLAGKHLSPGTGN